LLEVDRQDGLADLRRTQGPLVVEAAPPAPAHGAAEESATDEPTVVLDGSAEPEPPRAIEAVNAKSARKSAKAAKKRPLELSTEPKKKADARATEPKRKSSRVPTTPPADALKELSLNARRKPEAVPEPRAESREKREKRERRTEAPTQTKPSKKSPGRTKRR
jgi:hypothetical protein